MLIPLDGVDVRVGAKTVEIEGPVSGYLSGTYNPDDYKGKPTPQANDVFWLQVQIPLTAEQYRLLVATYQR